MLRPLTFATILALGAVLWSGAQADEVRDTLFQAEQKWADLFNAQDAAGLAATYSEDGMRLPPDASRVQGRKAIEAHLQEEFDAGVTNVELEPLEVGHAGGDMAWLLGNWSVEFPTDKGDMGIANGNYLMVYRKEADGVWRTVVETWNEAPSE